MSEIQTSLPACIVVLGLGNTLLSDEGVGVEALMRLQRDYVWPDHVTLLDGGVMGLDLLPYIETADAVLILDAVQTGQPAGTLHRLEGAEIPVAVALKLSVHQVGLQETLAMAQFRGTLPERLVLLGVVPATLALGVGLSEPVQAQLGALVNAAVRELGAGGVPLRHTDISAGNLVEPQDEKIPGYQEPRQGR